MVSLRCLLLQLWVWVFMLLQSYHCVLQGAGAMVSLPQGGQVLWQGPSCAASGAGLLEVGSLSGQVNVLPRQEMKIVELRATQGHLTWPIHLRKLQGREAAPVGDQSQKHDLLYAGKCTHPQ